MSRSGQAYVAKTQGTDFTMYAAMKAMGIPLSPEQEATQAALEKQYPPVAFPEDMLMEQEEEAISE